MNAQHILLTALAALLMCVEPALAHRLLADCRVQQEKGKIFVEAYFDDDTRPRAALVEIFRGDERIGEEVKSDAQGMCVLPLPEPGEYRVVINAGAGHRTERTIVVPTIPMAEVFIEQFEPARYPWERVGLGLGLIGFLALAAWVALRFLRT
jgi:hypothetical protein